MAQTGSNAYQGYALTFTSGENNGETVYVDSSSYSAGNVTLNYSPNTGANTGSGTTYHLTPNGIKINDRATKGLSNAEFEIQGNLPTSKEGKAEKGTFSVWVKPDFSYDESADKHYVYDSGLQRLYYDGADDKWKFEIWNPSTGSGELAWTTARVESAVQTFSAHDSIHLAATWNANNGLKLAVNNAKTTTSVTWTAQALAEANDMMTIGSKGGKLPTSLNEGLVGYWDMDGNFEDKSGNENDGTSQGGTDFSSGVFGKAGNFDGVDDYLSLAN